MNLHCIFLCIHYKPEIVIFESSKYSCNKEEKLLKVWGASDWQISSTFWENIGTFSIGNGAEIRPKNSLEKSPSWSILCLSCMLMMLGSQVKIPLYHQVIMSLKVVIKDGPCPGLYMYLWQICPWCKCLTIVTSSKPYVRLERQIGTERQIKMIAN